MSNSDIFIFHNDVDFIKGEWKNRNVIRMESNSLLKRFITVPIISKQMNKKLNKLTISYDKDWIKSHLNCIRNAYQKETFYKSILNILEKVFIKKHQYLSDLNIDLILEIKDFLEIQTEINYSSDFPSNLKKTEKLVFLLKKVKASTYLANNKSQNYIDEQKFKIEKIKLKYQNFSHPIYSQGKNPYMPYLSIIDCIAYYGKNARNFLNV